jgi:hypothetical protein
VWLGGCDWPVVSALRAQGALPALASLLDGGAHAVLASDPPRASAALEALRWPGRRTDASLAGRLHGLGAELGALEPGGANPLDALSWVLPEREGLFERLRAAGLDAANLLEGIPDGEDAAPLAAAARLVAAAEHDFVAVRVRALEALPPSVTSVTSRAAGPPDDVRETLRAIDAWLGVLQHSLDEDDVLIVLASPALAGEGPDGAAHLIAHGDGVPAGETPGRPAIRDVARGIAGLLGVDIDVDGPETALGWTSEAAVARRGRD